MKRNRISVFAIIIAVISILALGSCSTFNTLEYKPYETEDNSKPEPFILGNWILSTPRFPSYIDVIDLNEINHPKTFWLTINARHIKSKKLPYNTKIGIDSVVINNLAGDFLTSRKPTRVAAFEGNRGKYYYNAFDFYLDQGVDIPIGVNKVEVSFIAKLFNDSGELIEEKSISYILHRYESQMTVPLRGWR